MTQEVKIYRLFNGEMLIGTETKSTEFEVTIRLPMLFAMQSENNMALIPYNPFGESKEVVLNKNAIVYGDKARQEIVEQYQKVTGQIITKKSTLIV